MLGIDVFKATIEAQATHDDWKLTVRAHEQEQMSKLCRHRAT
jgi:hypothetical protein